MVGSVSGTGNSNIPVCFTFVGSKIWTSSRFRSFLDFTPTSISNLIRTKRRQIFIILRNIAGFRELKNIFTKNEKLEEGIKRGMVAPELFFLIGSENSVY